MTLCSYLILDTLDDLLAVQLETLYDVELRLTRAWHQISEATAGNRLRVVFQENLQAAMRHVNMMEQVAKIMDLDLHRKNCEAIQCLISQAERALEAGGDPELGIAALIVVARHIHHYKIAAYASLRVLAQRAGRPNLVQRFDQALEFEMEAERKLTKIAEIPSGRELACSAA